MTSRIRHLIAGSVLAMAALTVDVARAQDIDACIAASERAVSSHRARNASMEEGALQICASRSCPDVVRTSCQQRLEALTTPVVVPDAVPAPSVAMAPPPHPVASNSAWSPRKTLAIASGALGLVGVGVGSGFGIASFSDWADSQHECAAPGCANHAQAVRDQEAASSSAVVSTVAFGVGVAALAGAIVLWLTAPSAPSGIQREGDVSLHVVPTAGAGGGGVLLEGTF